MRKKIPFVAKNNYMDKREMEKYWGQRREGEEILSFEF